MGRSACATCRPFAAPGSGVWRSEHFIVLKRGDKISHPCWVFAIASRRGLANHRKITTTLRRLWIFLGPFTRADAHVSKHVAAPPLDPRSLLATAKLVDPTPTKIRR